MYTWVVVYDAAVCDVLQHFRPLERQPLANGEHGEGVVRVARDVIENGGTHFAHPLQVPERRKSHLEIIMCKSTHMASSSAHAISEE